MSIILRNIKGAPLTYNELDGNFIYLSQSYAFLNGPNTFNGTQTIVGNLNLFGSASFSFITSSTTEISSSVFGVTISTPTIRYGLYNVYDTGSTNTTASLAWDSINNYWLYQKATGSITSSAIFLTGPISTGGLGTEAKIPQYRVPMSNGDQSLVNSNIFTSGSFNTITGSTFIYSFASYTTPILGTGSGGFFLGGDNGLYGLYMGVSSLGTTWIQSNRNDGQGLAYNIALQPVGGNVNIGKFNPDNSGPKLDISGSTLLTGSLGILGNAVITGSLIVTNGITATASYASNANALDSLDSSQFAQTTGNQTIAGIKTFENPVVLGIDDFGSNGKLTFNTVDNLNIGNIKTSIEGGSIPTDGISTEFGDLLFLDNNSNVLAGLYQNGTGFKIISGSFIGNLIGTASLASTASLARTATTASYVLNAISSSFATTASFALNAVSSSFASTASFLRPLSQSVIVTGSVTLTGSLNIRNTATISTLTALGRSGSLYIDFVGLGLNYIDGNALFIRNSAGTTNLLTVSGSRFIVSTPTELSGSLSMRRADGDRSLFISSSVSSSTSTTVVGTTASFNGDILFTPGGSGTTWNTDLDIYYSGNSGSGHTNLSPVSNQIADNNTYNEFNIRLVDSGGGSGITLTPDGSIPNDKYTVWIYASGSINQWFEKIDNDLGVLEGPGLTISIGGPDTDTQLGNDLLIAGFSAVSDPNPYANNINVLTTVTASFTSSLMNVKADTTITGSFNVSGSTLKVGNNGLLGNNTVVGNNIIAGNNTISGSNIISGSNFLIGNTILSGSITISGSTTNNIIGTTAITGSLRLNSNGIGTGLFINGQKQFNYISLFHTASILPTQNVSGSFIFSNTAVSSSISVVSGSRITFENTGIYNIQFSAQLFTQTGATVDIWLKRNGVNIANSAGKIGPTGNNTYHLPAWNFVDTFTSGSYVEIAYQSNQTNTEFQYVAASGNIPAIPSIIASITQVS
jgi:hypothetical protein